MAENSNQESTSTGFSLKTIESFYNRNKKAVLIATIAIVVIIVSIFYYQNQIKAPKEKAASSVIFKAEYYFGLDSFKLALNGRPDMGGLEGFLGFNDIIDQYGGTKAGNLARYYAGVCNLQLGQYQEAIDHLKKFSSNDSPGTGGSVSNASHA